MHGRDIVAKYAGLRWSACLWQRFWFDLWTLTISEQQERYFAVRVSFAVARHLLG